MGDQKRREGIAERFLDDHDLAAGVVACLHVQQREIAVQKDAVGVGAAGGVAGKQAGLHRRVRAARTVAPGGVLDRRDKIFHKVRGRCQLLVVGLAVEGAEEPVDLVVLHLLERDRRQARRLAEGDVCLIGPAHRPVVVGAEIEVLVLVLFNLAVGVHRFDLVGKIFRYIVDVFPLAGGDALIALGQIKLNRGRGDQAVHLHPVQVLGVGIDDLRIPLGERLARAEDLHPHILIQKQVARLLAVGALLAQAVAGGVGVVVRIIVDDGLLLLGRLLCLLRVLTLPHRHLLGLGIGRLLGRRRLFGPLLGAAVGLIDAHVVRTDALHRFDLGGHRHQLLPLRKGVSIVGVVLLGKLPGKPAFQGELRLFGKLAALHLRDGGLGQHQGQHPHRNQGEHRDADVDQMQALEALPLRFIGHLPKPPSLKSKVQKRVVAVAHQH